MSLVGGSWCERVREAVSAEIDGEATGVDGDVVDAHLAVCGGCGRFAARAADVTRYGRVAPVRVPDRSAAIVAAVAADAAGVRALPVMRGLTAAAGAVQLALALPALLFASGAHVHLVRELGALQLAVAVGFLVAAWQPRRAAGLLPVALVVAVAGAAVAVVDLLTGATTVTAELAHLPELLGMVVLWYLVKATPSGASLRTTVPA